MTENKHLISVIIPSYNRADTVGQTIDSILAQQVDADIEVIIGDDCSTDNARNVLLKYKEQYPNIIQLIFHEQNIGLGANWAICAQTCKGKYICNCDNDDYWHNPHKLQLQLDYMESHPNSNILITNHRTHNRNTGEITECQAYIDHKNIQQSMWGGASFCNATIMYRADFLKSHVNLDEFISRRLSLQDWPIWVILTAYTDIDQLPDSTATFGIETVSITRANSVEQLAKRYQADKEVYRYLCELFPNKFQFDEKGWDMYVNGRLLSKAFEMQMYKCARQYGKECVGVSHVKQVCSQNFLLFYCFILSKKIKSMTNRLLSANTPPIARI